MPLRGMAYSAAGLGKIAKRLFDLRIGGGGGGGGGEEGPSYELYAKGNVSYPLGSPSYNTFNSVLTLQTGVSYDYLSAGVNFGQGIYNGDFYYFGQHANGQLGNAGGTNAYLEYTRLSDNSVWSSNFSCGKAFTVAIKTNGTLWSWGYSSYGGLGTGGISQTIPTQVGSATDWAKVSAGDDHVLAIKTDGTLWTWGYNAYGQLGKGNTTNTLTPTQVGTDTDWADVSGGDSTSLALKTDGTIWFCGSNTSRASGLGSSQSTAAITTFTQVGTDTDWQKIYNGGPQNFGIKTDGTLWGWGANYYGALGLGSGTKFVPTQIGTDTWTNIASTYYVTWGIKSDGSLWRTGWYVAGANANFSGTDPYSAGTNLTAFTQYGDATNWSWITGARGRAAFYFKNSSGEIYHVGQGPDPSNRYNGSVFKKFTDTTWSKIVTFSTGFIGIKPDKTMWIGLNLPSFYTGLSRGYYQIGEDLWDDVDIIDGDSDGLYYVAAIKSDGTLWQRGTNYAGGSINTSFAQVGSDTTWTKVVCGFMSFIALKENGTVWAFGDNTYGSLGQGTTTTTSSLIQVGSASNWTSIWSIRAGAYFIINDSDEMYSWGTSSISTAYLNRTNISAPTTAPSICTGYWKQVRNGVYGIKTDGTLWIWGSGGNSTYGINATSTATQVGTATDWIDAEGNLHTVEGLKGALLYYPFAFGIRGSNGKGNLYGWGYSTEGKVGVEITTGSTLYNIIYKTSFPTTTSPTLIDNSGGFVKVLADPLYYYVGLSTMLLDVALRDPN